jgi:hypothetical protein
VIHFTQNQSINRSEFSRENIAKDKDGGTTNGLYCSLLLRALMKDARGGSIR